jgi:hypothetical protein
MLAATIQIVVSRTMAEDESRHYFAEPMVSKARCAGTGTKSNCAAKLIKQNKQVCTSTPMTDVAILGAQKAMRGNRN